MVVVLRMRRNTIVYFTITSISEPTYTEMRDLNRSLAPKSARQRWQDRPDELPTLRTTRYVVTCRWYGRMPPQHMIVHILVLGKNHIDLGVGLFVASLAAYKV